MSFWAWVGFDMLCAVLDGARPICGQMREGLVVVSSLCRFLGRNAKPGWEADSAELYGHHFGLYWIGQGE